MGLNIEVIKRYGGLYRALLQRQGLDAVELANPEKVALAEASIAEMSAKDALDEAFSWEGIIGYMPMFLEWHEALREAEGSGNKWTVIYSAPWQDGHDGYMAHVEAADAEEALVRAVIKEFSFEGNTFAPSPLKADLQRIEVILVAKGHIGSIQPSMLPEDLDVIVDAIVAETPDAFQGDDK